MNRKDSYLNNFTMDLGIRGKTALVTASSKGIGKAVATALASEGARVIVSSSNLDNIKSTEMELKQKGFDVYSYVCDLSKASDVVKLADEVLRDFGKIDILVFNTGGPKPGYFFELEEEDWYRAFELVLMSAVRLTKKLLPKMIDNGWGRIIYLTSVAVKEPIDELLLSNVFRSGVNALSKSLSRTIRKDNVTFNVIYTGNIQTERAKGLLEYISKKTEKPFEEVKKSMESSIPLGRYGSVEEIANFVTFLCSEKASYVNGTSIQVDGGFLRSI